MSAHRASSLAVIVKGLLRRVLIAANESKIFDRRRLQPFQMRPSPDTDRVNDPLHTSYWNWGGQYIGYRAQKGLFLANGRQLGYFAEGDEVYACSGEYLGEVRGANRLLTNLSKKKWMRGVADPQQHKRSLASRDTTAKEIACGYEDFSP